MKHTALLLKLLLIATVLFSGTAAAQSPEILKLEPASWWVGSSVNPVRVLIKGRNLGGATLRSTGRGLRVMGRPVSNNRGTYMFADIAIAPNAHPGLRELEITTANGNAAASFEVLLPLNRTGRFQGFTTDDVIYLIMTDRFSDGDASNNDPLESPGLYDRSRPRYYHGGDFAGIISRLGYLQDLGVTAIWMTPWYDNVNHLNAREQYPEQPNGPKRKITDYHGYGAVDFYGVEEHFGTLAKLRELVDAAHRFGIKVIQDQVANHSGPYHPWVEDPPIPTWFNGTEANHLANSWQTWSVRDPHSPFQAQRETLEGWFINILPDLNQNDPEVARYIIQNTLWWVGVTGVDAIRQDTFQYVPRIFWRQWTTALKREFPKLNVVGEVLDVDVAQASFFQGGRARYDGIDDGLDALFDFPLMYSIRRVFAEGKDIRELPKILASDPLYVDASVLVTLIDNHDVKRFMSIPGATVEGLKMAQTLIMTMRGTPQLYYGDEIAMAGDDDPDNRRDFPGGFPREAVNAFQTRYGNQRSAFEHQKLLSRLRMELEPLRLGKLLTLFASEKQYVYARNTSTSSVIVAFNNDQKVATVEFGVDDIKLPNGANLTDRLGLVPEAQVANGKLKLALPPHSSAILVRN